jgi:hypothetical protein
MDNFKTALSAVGVSGAGVAFLYFLTKDLVQKADNLSSELLFILLALAFFLIFILTFKMLSKSKVSRDSSVVIGEGGYNSGTINAGDTNNNQKENNRDSSVSVHGHNTGDITTGDNNTSS